MCRFASGAALALAAAVLLAGHAQAEVLFVNAAQILPLDNSCFVDGADLAILLGAWTS